LGRSARPPLTTYAARAPASDNLRRHQTAASATASAWTRVLPKASTRLAHAEVCPRVPVLGYAPADFADVFRRYAPPDPTPRPVVPAAAPLAARSRWDTRVSSRAPFRPTARSSCPTAGTGWTPGRSCRSWGRRC